MLVNPLTSVSGTMNILKMVALFLKQKKKLTKENMNRMISILLGCLRKINKHGAGKLASCGLGPSPRGFHQLPQPCVWISQTPTHPRPHFPNVILLLAFLN